MAIVEYQPAIVGPLAALNEKLKNGVKPGVGDDAASWDNVKTVAESGKWNLIGDDLDSGEVDHIKEHWLGVGKNPWFEGLDTARVLQDGFTHALSVAGERPVASLWVPNKGASDVSVSVIENPTSVVVVIVSPSPPDGSEVAGPDDNVTTFSTADRS